MTAISSQPTTEVECNSELFLLASYKIIDLKNLGSFFYLFVPFCRILPFILFSLLWTEITIEESEYRYLRIKLIKSY